MRRKKSQKREKVLFDPDELQLMDECNRSWVFAWKQATSYLDGVKVLISPHAATEKTKEAWEESARAKNIDRVSIFQLADVSSALENSWLSLLPRTELVNLPWEFCHDKGIHWSLSAKSHVLPSIFILSLMFIALFPSVYLWLSPKPRRQTRYPVSFLVFSVEIGARMVRNCSLCEWLMIFWRVLGGTARICIDLTVIMSFSTLTFSVPFRTR